MKNELTVLDNTTPQELEKSMQKIKQFQAIIKNSLISGIDYGTIPGCGDKPTLKKSGAEKILRTFGLKPFFEILNEIEDFEKGLFFYKIKTHIYYGEEEIAQGIGSCSSWEDKYKYRWVFENNIPAGLKKSDLLSKTRYSKKGKPYQVFRVQNDDLITQANTILKMTKKRSLVDAALFVASVSDVFTQDIEDNPDYYAKSEETHDDDNEKDPKQSEPTNGDKPSEKQLFQIYGDITCKNCGIRIYGFKCPKCGNTIDNEEEKKRLHVEAKGFIHSHYLKKADFEKTGKMYPALLPPKLTKQQAIDIYDWWIGSKEKLIFGERKRREEAEGKVKLAKTTKKTVDKEEVYATADEMPS